jgi:hypothetical protein
VPAAAYDAKHDLTNSIAGWSEVIIRLPTNATTYLKRANTYLETKDYDKALADCGKSRQVGVRL